MADQQSKFAGANQAHRSVSAHNLDEVCLKLKAVYAAILRSAAIFRADTVSTVFLLSSPQFRVNHSELTAMLSRQAHRRLLLLVIIDEVHLHVQQGTTFHNESCELTTCFFLKVFSKSVPS